MPNEIDVTNTDTGTPGASDSTIPPTAAISANTTEASIVVTGELKTRPAAAADGAYFATLRDRIGGRTSTRRS